MMMQITFVAARGSAASQDCDDIGPNSTVKGATSMDECDSMPDIQRWCADYVADALGIDARDVNPDARIVDLGLGSLLACGMRCELNRLLPDTASFDWGDPGWTLRTLARALSAYAHA